MRIDDPFRLNDWSFRRFLAAVAIVQAAALLVLGLEHYGYSLPVIRQVVLFVYLAFIPGMLVLRALGIHKVGSAVATVYAVGASLAVLMLTGLFLDRLLPLVGYSQPIALLPLTLALTALVAVLGIISYARDRHYEGDASVELNGFPVPQALLLLLVPFLAIFGTYLMNHYGDNVLLLLLILAIGIIVLLIGFDLLIPRELYSLAIFVVAISLLFHNSLISDSLIGWDIHQEKFLADSIVQNGYWTDTMNYVLNAMMSIVMLAPALSIILDMDVTWVYKVVFPLVFALVPVALFQAYRKQSDDRLAFMAAFFFVALVVFFSEMLQLARQEIAELFLALLILLIVDRSMEKTRWSVLFVLFAFALVLSHYGLTYLFIGTLLGAWALTYVVSKLQKGGMRDVNRRLTPAIIMALVAFCAIWYIYTAAANPFHTVVDVTHRIEKPIEAMVSDYLKPAATPVPTAIPGTATATPVPQTTAPTPPPITTQPVEILATGGTTSALHRLFVYLMVSTQALLIIGVLAALFTKKAMRFRREFIALAFVNMAMLAGALVLPNFASALNTTRLYQITLIVLAPFFVLGWVSVFALAGRLTRRSASGTLVVAVELLSVFLVLYLIFNTGLIFEVAKDVPMSYSLDRQGDNQSYTIYNSLEVAGAEWTFGARDDVARNLNNSYVPPIFSDTYRWLLLQDWNTSRSYHIPRVAGEVPKSSYVYLGTYNVQNDLAIDVSWGEVSMVTTLVNLSDITGRRNRIYTNGGAEVYY